MNLLCVNEEYQHYFIDDDEPQPKLNKKNIRIYTDFIYTLKGYEKKQRKIFGLTIYSYWSKPKHL